MENPGSMPSHVLNLLNEYAIGGFVLYYFNSQNGHPEHIMNFETPAHCLALQKYIGDWHEGLKAVTLEAAKQSIQSLNNCDEDSSVE